MTTNKVSGVAAKGTLFAQYLGDVSPLVWASLAISIVSLLLAIVAVCGVAK